MFFFRQLLLIYIYILFHILFHCNENDRLFRNTNNMNTFWEYRIVFYFQTFANINNVLFLRSVWPIY